MAGTAPFAGRTDPFASPRVATRAVLDHLSALHADGAAPPSVDGLSTALGIDEALIRRALRDLVQSGHLRRSEDGPALVFDPWATRDRLALPDTLRDLRALGHDAEQRLFPTPRSARAQSAEPGGRLDDATTASVLTRAAGRPVSLARWWVDRRMVPGFKRSVGKGAAPLHALRTVAPALATSHALSTRCPAADEATVLEIADGAPCLEVETVVAVGRGIIAVGCELFAGPGWRIPLPSPAALQRRAGLQSEHVAP